MKKIVLLSALALALVPSPAFAKGNPHEKKEAKHHDRDHDRDDHHGKKAHEYRVSHNSGRPPGWDKGKKTGWGDCDVPPGQAKKIGCNSHSTHVTRTRHQHRPVLTTHNPRYPRARQYPRTTTTTTTTTQTAPTTKGTHPFEPVLRQKQSGGRTQAASTKQNIRY